MVHSVSGWTWGAQVKLWDPLRTRAIPERRRGALTTRRYTNPRLPLPLPYLTLPMAYRLIPFNSSPEYVDQLAHQKNVGNRSSAYDFFVIHLFSRSFIFVYSCLLMWWRHDEGTHIGYQPVTVHERTTQNGSLRLLVLLVVILAT